ncbi:hypothetical protein [Brevundimonas sp.]|uniref:hypothetical protein n=1 Tax=Brevundimonas sp. TaxID=1871086 RepID=UPI002FC695C9
MKKFDHLPKDEVLRAIADDGIKITDHESHEWHMHALRWQLAAVRQHHPIITVIVKPHPITVFLADALASDEPDLFERFMDSPTDELLREVIIHRGHYRLVDYPDLIPNIPAEIVLQAKMSM